MARKLINYLPEVLRNYREFQKTFEAEEPEVKKVYNELSKVLNDLFVEDATERGIKRWENILGIVPKPSENLEDRKFKILSKLVKKLPYTRRRLEQLLEVLCGKDGYSLTVFGQREVISEPPDVFFKFDGSLLSLKNIEPLGYDGATKTDYGLVVGDGLCATLLPEGGVAVEEGTVNLYADGDYESGQLHPVMRDGWEIVNDDSPKPQGNLGPKVLKCSRTDGVNTWHGRDIPISPNTTYTVSVWVWISPDFEGSAVRLVIEQAGGTLARSTADLNIRGKWQRLVLTGVSGPEATNTRVLAYVYRPTKGYVLYDGMQFEQKPFATSFVDGTRPPGALDIPTNLSLLQSGTIAFTVWTPKKMTDHDTYQNGALMDICRGDVRQLDLWMRDLGIEFCVNDERKKTISYEPNTKYKIIVTWEDGGNPKFYVDGALQYAGTEQFTDAGNGILQLGRFGGSYVNTVNFKNLLVCPYAVSPETVNKWSTMKNVPTITPYNIKVGVALTRKNNFDDVKNLLQEIIPANLVIDLSLMYNQHFTIGQYKHSELSAWTHDYIRSEVLNQ